MSWIYLILAICLEVAGTTNMKLSQGFTKILPSVLLFVFYACSFSLMTIVLKKIDVSVAYTIWSGLGTAFIVGIGIIWFKESVTLMKMISIIFIIIGVIGLKLSSGAQ